MPLLRLLTPQLSVENLRATLDALREILGRQWLHLSVAESADVRDAPGLKRGAVVRGHVAEAVGEGFRMHLRPVGSDRPREMHRIKLPRPRARRLERQ